MIRSIEEFAPLWTDESAKTVQILDALSDASLSQAVVPGGRTLGRLAWHLACTIHDMSGHGGLEVAGVSEIGTEVPGSARVIRDAYAEAAARLVPALRAQWSDAMLPEIIPMYGEQWPRWVVLAALVSHQTHHRGQMTVLMRQAGLTVPGMYGPAAEEWAAMGMPAMP